MRRLARLALAVIVMVASFMVVQYTYSDFFDSWTDILLALIDWSTFGYRLTPLTVVKALLYSIIEGLAVTALTVSALDIVRIATEKKQS